MSLQAPCTAPPNRRQCEVLFLKAHETNNGGLDTVQGVPCPEKGEGTKGSTMFEISLFCNPGSR